MATSKQYINKIKTKPKINQTINKGTTQTTIKNTQTVTTQQIQKAKEQLLQPLIKDETIKQIMTTDENFNKLKHRLTHNITAYNKQGEIILTTQKYNETIQETIQKTNKDLLNKQSDSAGLQLNQKGYKNTKILENQRITRIQITTTFKKA